MNKYLKILLFIIILIVIYEIYIHIDFFLYYIGINSRTYEGVRANRNIEKKVNLIISNLKYKNKFYIYDLGCSEGHMLNLFNNYKFKKIIGIELDKNVLEYTHNNVSNNIILYNNDILKFKYPNNPSIFYLYEPFHTLKYDIAMNMYNTLLKKLSKLDKIYIIFVSGILINKKTITEKILNKYNFKIINKYNVGSFLLRYNIYLIKN